MPVMPDESQNIVVNSGQYQGYNVNVDDTVDFNKKSELGRVQSGNNTLFSPRFSATTKTNVYNKSNLSEIERLLSPNKNEFKDRDVLDLDAKRYYMKQQEKLNNMTGIKEGSDIKNELINHLNDTVNSSAEFVLERKRNHYQLTGYNKPKKNNSSSLKLPGIGSFGGTNSNENSKNSRLHNIKSKNQ